MRFQPCVIAFSGSPLHGKGDAAKALIPLVENLLWYDVDQIRWELFPEESGRLLEDRDREGVVMVESYRELCRRGATGFRVGRPVLLTGTFSRLQFKAPLLQLLLSEGYDIPRRVFELTAEIRSIPARIESRQRDGNWSNITQLEQYESGRAFFESLPLGGLVKIATDDRTPEQVAEAVLEHLQALVAS